MMNSFRCLMLVLLLGVLLAPLGSAGAMEKRGYKSAIKEGDFADVLEDVKDAIINRGLVIDYVGHVDAMLDRTSETVGSVTEKGVKSPFLGAKYVQFCSAKITHDAVSANPYNIAVCPYVVFVFEERSAPGQIVVGYRRPILGPSRLTRRALSKIEALLSEIMAEATE